jgi:YHS domain-containing protein
MIRLAFWALIIYIAYLIVKNMKAKQAPGRSAEAERPRGETTYRDPVCGVFVAEEDAVVGRYQGERIHFCSMACLEKYQQQLADK